MKNWSRTEKRWVIGVGSAVLILFGGLMWGIFGTMHDVGTVAATEWEWHIDVVHWEKVHYRDKGSKPGGAYNVKTRVEANTVVTTDAEGNTSTSIEYDRRYTYDLDQWVTWRTFSKADGTKKPIPPEYELPTLPSSAQAPRQCQVGSVRQRFRVVVDAEKIRIWETDQVSWSKWNKGDLCDVNLTGFGSIRRLEKIKTEIAE